MTQAGTKAYWKFLNKLLNISNIPIIPPIVYNNKFISSFAEKGKWYPTSLLSHKQLVDIEFSVEDLKNTIHTLDPNKSHGPDNILIRMVLIYGNPILFPLVRPDFL